MRYLEEMLRAGESVAVAKEDGVYLLLNYRAEDYENVLFQLREVIKRMKRESDIYGQFAMTIALGKQVGDIGGMRESILTARAAWQQRMLFHNNEMIAYDRLKMDAEAFSMWDDREWSGFCEALESCDQNRISVFLNGCRKKVQEIRNLSLESLFEQIRKITMDRAIVRGCFCIKSGTKSRPRRTGDGFVKYSITRNHRTRARSCGPDGRRGRAPYTGVRDDTWSRRSPDTGTP